MRIAAAAVSAVEYGYVQIAVVDLLEAGGGRRSESKFIPLLIWRSRIIETPEVNSLVTRPLAQLVPDICQYLVRTC